MYEFTTARGRVYSVEQVRPIVLRLLRDRWSPTLPQGWRERALAKLDSGSEWLRFRSGCTPGSLARDLEDVVFAGEEADER